MAAARAWANVEDGVIGATSQQYPLDMASKGIEAIAAFARTAPSPTPTEGKAFRRYRRGAGDRQSRSRGVESIDSARGTELCWG